MKTPVKYQNSSLEGHDDSALRRAVKDDYLNDPENRHGLKLTENALILDVLFALASILLPGMRQARQDTKHRAYTIAATLLRLESAKAQYAADYHKKPGDPVTLETLVREGYLKSAPIFPAGGAYVIGPVGVPVEYDADQRAVK